MVLHHSCTSCGYTKNTKGTCLLPANKLPSCVGCADFPKVYLASLDGRSSLLNSAFSEFVTNSESTHRPIYGPCTHTVVTREVCHMMPPQVHHRHMQEWGMMHQYNSAAIQHFLYIGLHYKSHVSHIWPWVTESENLSYTYDYMFLHLLTRWLPFRAQMSEGRCTSIYLR